MFALWGGGRGAAQLFAQAFEVGPACTAGRDGHGGAALSRVGAGETTQDGAVVDQPAHRAYQHLPDHLARVLALAVGAVEVRTENGVEFGDLGSEPGAVGGLRPGVGRCKGAL